MVAAAARRRRVAGGTVDSNSFVCCVQHKRSWSVCVLYACVVCVCARICLSMYEARNSSHRGVCSAAPAHKRRLGPAAPRRRLTAANIRLRRRTPPRWEHQRTNRAAKGVRGPRTRTRRRTRTRKKEQEQEQEQKQEQEQEQEQEEKYEEVSVAFWELARNKIRFNNQFI